MILLRFSFCSSRSFPSLGTVRINFKLRSPWTVAYWAGPCWLLLLLLLLLSCHTVCGFEKAKRQGVAQLLLHFVCPVRRQLLGDKSELVGSCLFYVSSRNVCMYVHVCVCVYATYSCACVCLVLLLLFSARRRECASNVRKPLCVFPALTHSSLTQSTHSCNGLASWVVSAQNKTCTANQRALGDVCPSLSCTDGAMTWSFSLIALVMLVVYYLR